MARDADRTNARERHSIKRTHSAASQSSVTHPRRSSPSVPKNHPGKHSVYSYGVGLFPKQSVPTCRDDPRFQLPRKDLGAHTAPNNIWLFAKQDALGSHPDSGKMTATVTEGFANDREPHGCQAFLQISAQLLAP